MYGTTSYFELVECGQSVAAATRTLAPRVLLLKPARNPLIAPLLPLALGLILSLECKERLIRGVEHRPALRRNLSAPVLGGSRLLAFGRAAGAAALGGFGRSLRQVLGVLRRGDSRGCSFVPEGTQFGLDPAVRDLSQ